LESQASWWASNYHPGGDQNQFVLSINNYEATKRKNKTQIKASRFCVWGSP